MKKMGDWYSCKIEWRGREQKLKPYLRGQRGHMQALMWLVEDRKFGEGRIGRREDAERRGKGCI